MSKPGTFQDLATNAHDIKVTIANSCGSSFSVAEFEKDYVEVKKNVKFSKNSTKVAFKAEPIQITGRLDP